MEKKINKSMKIRSEISHIILRHCRCAPCTRALTANNGKGKTIALMFPPLRRRIYSCEAIPNLSSSVVVASTRLQMYMKVSQVMPTVHEYVGKKRLQPPSISIDFLTLLYLQGAQIAQTSKHAYVELLNRSLKVLFASK